MNYYYPYSTTYLRQHMSRLSRGFVILGLAALSWVILAFAAIGIWQFASRLFS